MTDPFYELIANALEMIINWRMPFAQAKKAIQWVSEGNDTQVYNPTVVSKGKNQEPDPLAETWKGLDPQIKVKYKGDEKYEIHLTATGGQKAVATAQAAQRALQGGFLQSLLKSS